MSLEFIRTILLLCQTEFVSPESVRTCVKEYVACIGDAYELTAHAKLLQCYLNKAKK